MPYSVGKHYRIYDDATGEYVAIRPDADGMQCVEIIKVDANGTERFRLFMPPTQAKLVASAIGQLVTDLAGDECL